MAKPRQADTATFDTVFDEESTMSTQARTHSADGHRADLDFYPPCHTPEVGYVALRKAA